MARLACVEVHGVELHCAYCRSAKVVLHRCPMQGYSEQMDGVLRTKMRTMVGFDAVGYGGK